MKKPAAHFCCLMLAFGLAYLALLVGAYKAGAGASANAGQLILTEVSFGDRTNDWAGLYECDGVVSWSCYSIW